MKTIVFVILLLALGAGGAYMYLRVSKQPSATAPQTDATTAVDSGHDQLHQAADAGKAELCAKHGIPDAVCAFCHPEYIEKFGFCGGHDVPEALCTRCSPVLIAAFKIEGDWCAEHDLPESQCKICKGEAGAAGDDHAGHDHG